VQPHNAFGNQGRDFETYSELSMSKGKDRSVGMASTCAREESCLEVATSCSTSLLRRGAAERQWRNALRQHVFEAARVSDWPAMDLGGPAFAGPVINEPAQPARETQTRGGPQATDLPLPMPVQVRARVRVWLLEGRGARGRARGAGRHVGGPSGSIWAAVRGNPDWAFRTSCAAEVVWALGDYASAEGLRGPVVCGRG